MSGLTMKKEMDSSCLRSGFKMQNAMVFGYVKAE